MSNTNSNQAGNTLQTNVVVNIQANNQGVVQAIQQTNTALTNLGNNQGVAQATAPIGNLRTAMRDAQNEAQRLLMANQQNTDAYQAAIARVADLRDQQQLYNRAVAANDAGNRFAGVSSAAQVATGAVSTLSGTFKTLGINSQALDGSIGILQTIVGLISLLDAIPDMGDFLLPFRNRLFGVQTATQAATTAQGQLTAAQTTATAATTAQGTATAATTTATQAATVATKTFSTALKSIGIGLIVSALTYLITNFDKVKSTLVSLFPILGESKETFNELKEVFSGIGSAVVDCLIMPITTFINLIQGNWSGAMESMRKGFDLVGNYQSGYAKKQKEIAAEQRREDLENEKVHLENKMKLLKASGEAGIAEQRRINNINKELAATSTKDEKEKNREIVDAGIEAQVFELGLIKERNDKIAAERKAAAEKLKAQRKADLDAALAQDKEHLKVVNDAFVDARTLELQNLKTKYDEKSKLIDKLEKEATAEELAAMAKAGTSIAKMRKDLFESMSIEEYNIKQKFDKQVEEYLEESHDSTMNAYDKRVKDIQVKAAELLLTATPEQRKLINDVVTNETKVVRTEEQLTRNSTNSETNLQRVEFENASQDSDSAEQAIRKIQAIAEAQLQAEQDAFELKKSQLVGQNDEIARITEEHELAKLGIERDFSEQRKEIAEREKEAKREIKYAELDILGQFGGVLQDINKKNKTLTIAGIVAEKAATVGKIIMDTSAANAKAVATSPLTLGQPWVTLNTISGGLGVAATALAARNAIAGINSGSDSGNGSGASGGMTAPNLNAAPVINSTQLNDNGVQDVRVTNNQAPLKAYVVDKELRSKQEYNNFIESTSSI